MNIEIILMNIEEKGKQVYDLLFFIKQKIKKIYFNKKSLV